ncbi:PLP-dependent transferase [Pluteus cervinus]|uniref:PLP-dependent transferase n=1 Tax=Pluteus cervinus TaxID=181527 RepID=A0ACD3ANB4_9AGAR|nr:PLP-dependent transferase [Pluteus cervinus]
MSLPEPSGNLYKTTPPEYGYPMLKYFGFDPEYVNLNHGSYGSLPRPVAEVVNQLAVEAEANPDRFHRFTYQPLLTESRAQIAKLIGAKTDECVLVHNASLGVNTVLRNIEWQEGDIIIDFNTTYGSVARTAESISDTHPHPTVSHFTVLFPTTHAEILQNWKAHLRSLPKTRSNGKSRRRVAIIDGIVSNPGVLLPWEEMVKICREEGVLSVIDAAHCIGQSVNINLAESQPDFWVSNCHKWLFSKRGCAVLYISERSQHLIKTPIPTSHAYVSVGKREANSLVQQFEWNGTIDFISWLTVPSALAFREWIGGEVKINAYCHDLALKGGKRLAEVMGTTVLDPEGDLTVNMVNVELPFPRNIEPTYEIDGKFKQKLLFDRNMYSAHFYHNGRWWTRCSAQVWNQIEDFEKIGKAWIEVCQETLAELGLDKNVSRGHHLLV